MERKKIGEGKWERSSGIVFVGGPDGGVICEMSEPDFSPELRHRPIGVWSPYLHDQMERAEFIVRAGNSFADLLAACKAAAYQFRHSPFIVETSPEIREAIEQLDAAIAKAEGGPWYDGARPREE